ALALVVAVSFAVLGGVGIKVLRSAPPIPSQVVTSDGRVLFDGATIQDGQGSYVAPDWSADWLHRESMFILNRWAAKSGAANYAALGPEQQAALQARL